MPELPEVETMRQSVAPIVGRHIVKVRFPRCRYRPIKITPSPPIFRRKSLGRRIVAIDRIGKRLLVRLDNDHAIVFEPRMTGLVLLADAPDADHLRLGIELEGGGAEQLWFWDRRGLGSIRLLSSDQLQKQLGPRRVGPDALDVSAKELARRLGPSRRAVKVALLDQRSVAGIGNLYACEILHDAAIHPLARCDHVASSGWLRIVRSIRRILRQAIQSEGSTLNDGTYRNALNQMGRYQNHHRVYDREGQRCLSCGKSSVSRIVQAQRSTFFCPRCQKMGNGALV